MASDRARAGIGRRLMDGAKRLFWVFLYLWVLFGLFALHESLVLAKYQIDYKPFGYAFVNAWVLAKVMLVADDLNLGADWFERHPLIYRILSRALLFAVVFMAAHAVESMLVGLWHGKTIAQTMPELSSRYFTMLLSKAVIVAVALMPFFAFKALDQVLGVGTLRSLFLAQRQAASSHLAS